MAIDIEFAKDKVRIFSHDLGVKTLWAGSDSFIKRLQSTFYMNTGLIPPGLRWVSPAKNYWLFESAPRYQTIIFHEGKIVDDPENQVLYKFTIALPWTATLIEINTEYFPTRTWIVALKGPIQSHNDRIGLLPLPNHYPCAQICYPGNSNKFASTTHSIADAYNLAKDFAWSSYANEDVTETYVRVKEHTMPYFLFKQAIGKPLVLDKPQDFLAKWEKTPLAEIIEAEYISPCDSITEPEALMRSDNYLPSVGDLMYASAQSEALNYKLAYHFEDLISQAHACSI